MMQILLITVVDKHSGTLTFETTENIGSTFYIRLPIAQNSRCD